MILWSTKNEKEIICNHSTFKFPHKIKIGENKSTFGGVVAVWYYDGEMHHNYLLEEGDMELTKKPYSLTCASKNKTSFYEENGKFKVIINHEKKRFDFDLEIDDYDAFVKPTYSKSSYLNGSLSYSALGIPKTSLAGSISEPGKTEKIKGTAYFQYVIVNAPSPPWYWGIFHFNEGSILSYFNPHIGPVILKGNLIDSFIGKGNISLSNEISFANKKTGKKEFYKIKKLENKKNSLGQPVFAVSGENKEAKISFDVDCYASSYWEFEKKYFGFLKTKLRYNEYPAKIKNFKIQYKNGVLVSSKEIGEGIGNAEHSWGVLI